MSNGKLEKYLTEFNTIADDWFKKATFIKNHFDFFQSFFEKKNLETLSWEQVQKMGDNLHAANSLGKAAACNDLNAA